MFNIDKTFKLSDTELLTALLQEQKVERSFDIIGLDGFLHGITSLPKMIKPVDWLESVWVSISEVEFTT